MGKRGLSDVVTTVLIILLVLAAILIVWGFIRGFLSNAGQSINVNQVLSNARLSIASIESTPVQGGYNARVVVKSLSDYEVDEVRFVFTDVDGKTEINDSAFKLGNLESKTFNILLTIKPVKVEVAPIIEISGKRRIGSIMSILNIIYDSNGVGTGTGTSSSTSSGNNNPSDDNNDDETPSETNLSIIFSESDGVWLANNFKYDLSYSITEGSFPIDKCVMDKGSGEELINCGSSSVGSSVFDSLGSGSGKSLTICVNDSVGHKACDSISFGIDDGFGPDCSTSTISGGSGGVYSSANPVSVTPSCTDTHAGVNSATITVDCGGLSCNGNLPAGTYDVHVTAVDNAGISNYGYTSPSGWWTIGQITVV